MKKLIGIFVFLMILYVSILAGTPRDWDVWASNHHNLAQRIGHQ